MNYDNKNDECYIKASKRGQRTFTLVEQDLSSPVVILEWIKQNIETCPEVKLRDAFEDALAMRRAILRKHAD